MSSIFYCFRHLVMSYNKRQRKPKGKSRIDIPEKTGNIGYTRHRTKTSKQKTQHNTEN